MRHPLWGRNQETYGEDPYLSSILGQQFVYGLQGGMVVSAKSRYMIVLLRRIYFCTIYFSAQIIQDTYWLMRDASILTLMVALKTFRKVDLVSTLR